MGTRTRRASKVLPLKEPGKHELLGIVIVVTFILWALLMSPRSWEPQSLKLPFSLLASGFVLMASSWVVGRKAERLDPLDLVVLGAFLTLLGLGLHSPHLQAVKPRAAFGLLWLGAYMMGRTGIMTPRILERTLALGSVLLVVTGFIQGFGGVWIRPDSEGHASGMDRRR